MALLEYLSRFHVALVHFPIGLVVSAALVEVFGVVRRYQTPTVTATVMTLIGAAASLPAAWLGWELAEHTAHSDAEDILALHRWGGVVSAGLCVIVAALGVLALRGRPGLRWPFRGLLFITAILIGLTAHWGGELIYGEDYFSWSAAGDSAADPDTP